MRKDAHVLGSTCLIADVAGTSGITDGRILQYLEVRQEW